MADHVRQHVTQYSLGGLLRMVEEGRLRPSPFSRPIVWSGQQVADFFDSIYRGYPVGALIVIEQPVDEEDILIANRLIHAPSDQFAMVLVDGVQRVGAIIGALGESQDDPGSQFQVSYDFASDRLVSGDFDDNRMLPLRYVIHQADFFKWMRAHPFLTESELAACERLSDALSSYSIPVISLAGAEAWSTAQQIFTRINDNGVALSRSDLARASVAHLSTEHASLYGFQRETEQLGFGRLPIELCARCVLVTAEISGEQEEQLRSQWTRPQWAFEQLPAAVQRESIEKALNAIVPAIEFLREYAAVPHVKLLPQRNILPIIVRFIYVHSPPRGRVSELLRRWVWRSVSAARSHSLSAADIICRDDPLDEAAHLLDSQSAASGKNWAPSTSVSDLSTASGRINALALLSLRPSLLIRPAGFAGADDLSVTAPAILIPWLDDARSAFCELIPWRFAAAPPGSLGGYLLHPPADRKLLMQLVMSSESEDLGLLAGHCIDQQALARLKSGDLDGFVEYRAGLMAAAILARVRSMARWGFRDRGELPTVSGDLSASDGGADGD
jgi:Protein of unknown function DUF262